MCILTLFPSIYSFTPPMQSLNGDCLINQGKKTTSLNDILKLNLCLLRPELITIFAHREQLFLSNVKTTQLSYAMMFMKDCNRTMNSSLTFAYINLFHLFMCRVTVTSIFYCMCMPIDIIIERRKNTVKWLMWMHGYSYIIDRKHFRKIE